MQEEQNKQKTIIKLAITLTLAMALVIGIAASATLYKQTVVITYPPLNDSIALASLEGVKAA